MLRLSSSVPSLSSDSVLGDWFWLLEGHGIELFLVAALVISLRVQFKRWARMHH